MVSVLPRIENNIAEYTTFNYSNYKEGVILDEKDPLSRNMEKISLISTLSDNWNGNGASPFSKELISKIKGIIYYLEYQPEIFPTACDSIQLEYEKDNGEYLEFELFENENLVVYRVDKDGFASTKEYEFDIQKVNKEIKSFYEC
jgi:hypothetical protein